MKTILKPVLVMALATVFSLTANGQNLVPNPSFEEHNQCPNFLAQFNDVNNWTIFKNSPDYWNACDNVGNGGVPANCGGYQFAATGVAYAGIHTYSGGTGSGYREFMGVHLVSPLIKGNKYFVTMKVSPTFLDHICTTTCRVVSNKIGALFTTMSSADYPITNFANIYTDSTITDTLNWTVIRGSFIADSAYQYIVIGNFFADSLTASFVLNPGGDYNAAYYYVDDVCVSTDSMSCVSFHEQIEENNWQKAVTVYPNPCLSELKVEINAPMSTIFVKIYNVEGKEILSDKIQISNNYFTINTNFLSSGIYMLVVQANNGYIKIPFNKN